tara:strand:+ start:635 stop:1102 length:468 start_codon:yes stop_codon:yes gene_type:complete
MTKKMTTRQARRALVYGTDDDKEGVRQELAAIGASNITDVLSWTESGAMTLLRSGDIPLHVQKAIKKVKVTPNQYGNSIEVEMHDKLSALRVLAKHHGLMEPNADSDTRPSVIGINMKGPAATTYEVIEDGANEPGQESEDQQTKKNQDDQPDLF